MAKQWLCECGNGADGDRCMACGAYAKFGPENRVEPGSYAAMIGWPRTALAAKYYGLFIVLWLGMMLFGATLSTPTSRPWILAIGGLVAFRALLWPALKAGVLRAYARLRFGR